jgi:hypothetical protein
MFGVELGRAHQLELLRAVAAERGEERDRQARLETATYEAAGRAEAYRQMLEVRRAAAMADEQRAGQQERERAAERVAQAQNYRDRLLESGQGHWRTIAEILAAASGRVPS